MRRPLVILVTVLGLVSTGLVSHGLVPGGPTAPATAQEAPRQETALSWHRCPKDLAEWRCATLTVPRDWVNPADGLTVDVELAVRSATGDRIGALTFNPGGPGGSGLDAAPLIYALLPNRVKAAFDFVAFDPRGIGASQPQLKDCLPSASRENYVPPDTGPVDWVAFAEGTREGTAAQLGPCWEANQDLAPYLGTDYVVEDLEAMRHELGYDDWNIWGMSYGSRIAYRYARAYPDRVRAMILDGALPPSMTISEWAANEAWAFTYAQAVFGSLFGDRMAARLDRILRTLNDRTVVINGRERTRWGITLGIFSGISSQAEYPTIVKLIDTVYDAMFRTASPARQRQAARDLERLERLAEKDRSGEVYSINMINCADLGSPPSVEQVASFAEAGYVNSSVAAGFVATTKGTLCAGLPMPIAVPYPAPEKMLELRTPPVVLNSLGDTRTPWAGARTLASSIAGAWFITYLGTQHVTWLRTTSACVNKRITDYLMTLKRPGSHSCDYAPLKEAPDAR